MFKEFINQAKSKGKYDNNPIDAISNPWIIIEKEPIPPENPEIPFVNNIIVKSHEENCPWDIDKTIEIQGDIKVFAKKYVYSESDCDSTTKAGKGDDIGFTLVFGNYGEFYYTAQENPTVEDKITVPNPVDLRLMSLCICEGYKLFYGDTDKEVKVCDVLDSQTGTYNLQVRKLVGVKYISNFDIPCHYVCSISMLFQIEFPCCTKDQ